MLAALALTAVPSAAGRDARRTVYDITVSVVPGVNANPQQNPPRLGTSAKFLVSYSQSPGPCSTLSTTMTVTGPNAQVKTSTAGGAMTYIGRKAGVDRVKFTFGKSVCSGTSDFNVVVSRRTEFNVVWGQDAWQMGVCAVGRPPRGHGKAWLKAFKTQCVDDPVAEGPGIFELSVVDAVVPSPGDPAIIERTYNSTDDRGWFSGVGWSFPYLTTIGGDADRLQFYGFDGQRFLFQKRPDGTWAPLNGQTVTLTQVSNTYTLKFVDGTVWTYSGSSLTSITKNAQVTRVQPGLYGSTSSVTLANGIPVRPLLPVVIGAALLALGIAVSDGVVSVVGLAILAVTGLTALASRSGPERATPRWIDVASTVGVLSVCAGGSWILGVGALIGAWSPGAVIAFAPAVFFTYLAAALTYLFATGRRPAWAARVDSLFARLNRRR